MRSRSVFEMWLERLNFSLFELDFDVIIITMQHCRNYDILRSACGEIRGYFLVIRFFVWILFFTVLNSIVNSNWKQVSHCFSYCSFEPRQKK